MGKLQAEDGQTTIESIFEKLGYVAMPSPKAALPDSSLTGHSAMPSSRRVYDVMAQAQQFET